MRDDQQKIERWLTQRETTRNHTTRKCDARIGENTNRTTTGTTANLRHNKQKTQNRSPGMGKQSTTTEYKNRMEQLQNHHQTRTKLQVQISNIDQKSHMLEKRLKLTQVLEAWKQATQYLKTKNTSHTTRNHKTIHLKKGKQDPYSVNTKTKYKQHMV